VAVEGKQKEKTVRKAMDPQQHETTTNDVLLLPGTDRLPKRWTRSFSSPPSQPTSGLHLVQSDSVEGSSLNVDKRTQMVVDLC
jgi:hypothetical protein